MMRGFLAAFTAPKPSVPPFGDAPLVIALGRLVICPVELNVTLLLIPLNCVWLGALNISHRSCSRRPPSLVIGRFLNTETSQLLIPGPKYTRWAESIPVLPLTAGANTEVLI